MKNSYISHQEHNPTGTTPLEALIKMAITGGLGLLFAGFLSGCASPEAYQRAQANPYSHVSDQQRRNVAPIGDPEYSPTLGGLQKRVYLPGESSPK
ncbi:MAG: hypothetical protein AABW80_04685 [Nanoarchaeota archaeon]